MAGISNQRLYDYNRQGLIPGPKEAAEEFLKRVDYCKNLSKHLEGKLPFKEHEGAPREVLEKGIEKTLELFDIAPDWLPLFFSNYKLPPWHAAAAWIFQVDEHSPLAALVQVRKTSWIDQTEAVAHEICHAARMSFSEERYEEMLAWQTTTSWPRKTFSPIIERAVEGNLFVMLMLLMIILDIFLLQSEYLANFIIWTKLLVIAPLLYASFRLWRKHAAFKRALKVLGKITDRPYALMFRFTDREIEQTARGSPQAAVDWILKENNNSLRGRILASYLCTLAPESSLKPSPLSSIADFKLAS